ncbi:MAG TPA: carboxypeptidase-like regulatory domain-containing protein [Bryobacteraceae bacterium]
MSRFLLKSVIASVAALFLSTAMYAQSDSGTIVGYVRDPSAAVVPNAKVTLKNEATNITREATTNESGYFVAANMPPGVYTVSAEIAGFKKTESVHNKLDATSTLNVDINLQVGAATESVEVVATGQALQTESAVLEKLVTRTQIDALELNGRDPLFLASLQPGMRSGSTLGDFSFSLTSGGYAANGARAQDTTITFDGAPAVRTRANGTSIGVADVDSTQEVQIMTGNYDAEYGRAAGAQIRIVTKGGSSQFHGGLYEYFRNSDLNANTWSRNQSVTTNFQSPFRYNQFGFNIGGPVIIPHVIPKDKMFFFFGEEWARYRNAQTQTQEVPSLLMRQGNFSELLGPNIYYSKPTTIYDPTTCAVAGAAGCVPFAGNIIPASRLSKNGLALINMYPTPTPGYLSGNQNWIAAAAQPENQRKETINSDMLPTQNDRIQFRRTALAYFEVDPFDQGTNLTPKEFNRPNQAGSVSWIHTFSPSLLNEARGTVSLDDVYIPVITSAPGFNRQTLGVTYPYIFPAGKDLPNKVPSLNVPNMYSFSAGPYPSHSTGPIYTFTDTVTKIWGNHTFKAGFYFERSGENDGDQINVSSVPGGSNNQNGTFTFTDARAGYGATSGVGVANLALGLADSYTEIGQRAYTIYRGFLYEWFAQDSWKVNRNLTLSYGIRQSINIPYKALWGNQVFFDPKLYSSTTAPKVDPKTGFVIIGTGDPYDGMVIPGSGWPSNACGHGVTPACGSAYNGLFHNYPDQYVNNTAEFQPRVGLAYSLGSKTVLRAGIGRYQTRFGLLDNIFPGANSPFQPFVTVNNVSVDNPGAALGSTEQAAITVTTLQRNLKPPSAWNYNVTVQRQFFWKSVVEVGWVGHRGLNVPLTVDINQPQAGAVVSGLNVNAVRPYQGFAAIQMEESSASSTYNGLQASWNRRFANGFSFGASYTLSKSYDNSSNYRDIVPDTYNQSNMWGPSEYDTRHIVTFNYVYTLPFFKDARSMAGKTLGGWQISGVNQYQTGTPCGVFVSSDIAQVGEVGSLGCGQTAGEFAQVNGTPSILGQFAGGAGAASPNQYFAITSGGSPIFTNPALGTFNLQKNIRGLIYQPGFQDWNLGLYKKFAMNERTGFEFRAEAFDVNNHPNWSGVASFNPTSSVFGKVTSKTGLSRNLQLSLRYYF